ncbi:MAG TPA: IPT/TIG domain-containing protein, partial [Methylomirabilota bacterium]|nr:IPT/TIG domain-containing protein [Methylomirabilota bacterium]
MSLTNGVARLHVSGQSGQFVRLDASSNLLEWLPFDLFFNTNGVASRADPGAINLPRQFYRAAQVLPQPGVLGLSHRSGAPGTRITIYGQFFEAGKPGDNVVRFGGVEAPVLEVSATHLVTEVPASAATGRITVTSPEGTATSADPFIVTGLAQVSIVPPPGLAGVAFEAVNAYGSAGGAGGAGIRTSSATIPVREGMPQLTAAVTRDTNREAFFYAVTLSSREPIALGAVSTAETLVFANPFFLTLDLSRAEFILGVIRGDTNVQHLAAVLTQLYSETPAPFESPAFDVAYSNALTSVYWQLAGSAAPAAGGAVAASASGQLRPAAAVPMPSRETAIVGLDLEFVTVNRDRASPRVLTMENVGFNPVDWLVVIQELDVNRSFPNGPPDFNQAVVGKGKDRLDRVIEFSLASPGGLFRRTVSANLLFSRFDIVASLLDEAADFLDGVVSSNSFTMPNEDAIYVVRAVGPSLGLDFSQASFNEQVFLSESYPRERTTAIALNIMHGVFDFVSIVLDVKDVKLADSVMAQYFMKMMSSLPTYERQEQFPGIVLKTASAMTAEVGDKVTDERLKALLRGATRGLFKTIADKGLLPLRLIAGFGQIAERASGIGRTSPLETALI